MGRNMVAIFDLDGTLFDTGEVNYYAYKNALEEFGVELKKNYFVTKCNGRHYTEFLPMLLKDDVQIERVHREKKKYYQQYLDMARENSHLFQLISLMDKEYHIALVTTASRKNTLDILQHFEREGLFELVITQEDIHNAKPDPEGFLRAISYFDARPQDTIIFEDSDVGIQAARATGASVVVVDRF